MAYDQAAERLRCKIFERSGAFAEGRGSSERSRRAFRATITKQRRCTGDPKERRERLKREEAKLRAWLNGNRTTHHWSTAQ